jgi:hypothetical protein
MGEEWNSTWYLLVFTKLIIGLHIAIGVMNWNLCAFLYSNIAKITLARGVKKLVIGSNRT